MLAELRIRLHSAVYFTYGLHPSRSPDSFRLLWYEQRSREFADAINQVRRLDQFFDFAHDCAADHRGICKTPDFAYLFWSRDAKPDCDWQIADRTHTLHKSFGFMCHFTSRSRHACTRDSIDEPTRLLRDTR